MIEFLKTIHAIFNIKIFSLSSFKTQFILLIMFLLIMIISNKEE